MLIRGDGMKSRIAARWLIFVYRNTHCWRTECTSRRGTRFPQDITRMTAAVVFLLWKTTFLYKNTKHFQLHILYNLTKHHRHQETSNITLKKLSLRHKQEPRPDFPETERRKTHILKKEANSLMSFSCCVVTSTWRNQTGAACRRSDGTALASSRETNTY